MAYSPRRGLAQTTNHRPAPTDAWLANGLMIQGYDIVLPLCVFILTHISILSVHYQFGKMRRKL